jgi:hypothetical protein
MHTLYVPAPLYGVQLRFRVGQLPVYRTAARCTHFHLGRSTAFRAAPCSPCCCWSTGRRPSTTMYGECERMSLGSLAAVGVLQRNNVTKHAPRCFLPHKMAAGERGFNLTEACAPHRALCGDLATNREHWSKTELRRKRSISSGHQILDSIVSAQP